MNIGSKKKIVLLGMMTKMPVAGVVWQNIHYLIGLQRLGYDVYYVEQHARTPSMFMQTEQCDGSTRAAEFISGVMKRFDLGDRWCFHALHEKNGRYLGLSEVQLRELFASAELIINLHGGTEPLPEHYATGRLVYLETDPVQLQIELHDQLQQTIDFLEPHCAFFTFGENIGNSDCGLPVSARFDFKPTRQPVVMEFWNAHECGPAEVFTSIGNWQQQWREVRFKGETYTWSKHFEFLKFIDLPGQTAQRFELALSSYDDATRQMLEQKSWKVRHGLDISMDIDVYRDYIAGSRGEFTVAKDQNVRLRSGWFSDRSATYLAAGRPVITQETGFSNILPTGAGLFGFSTMEEVLGAIDEINSKYESCCGTAREIAQDYFNYDVVLGAMLDSLGVTAPAIAATNSRVFPSQVVLTPLSRCPLKLPESTLRAVLAAPLPATEPLASEPRASVVVVTFNNLPFTRLCLASVLAHTDEEEIIVVDNASTDGTPEFLGELATRNSRVRFILNDTNRGFAAATNQGLAAARGECLVLLNNDTIVPPGWLIGLMAHLQNVSVGLVGPVTNRIGNEAQIDVGYTTFGGMLDFASKQTGDLFDIARPAMFCLAMRRNVFKKIGPLDEQFGMGLFEDDDYAMRARAEGLRVVCAGDVFVHHFSQASFGALVPGGEYQRLLAANRERFQVKWGTSWSPAGIRPSEHYKEMIKNIRDVVRRMIPHGASVLVLSKGGDELSRLDGYQAGHFPSDETGCFAGYYPKDSAEAIARLESARAHGAEFLLVPETARWWLTHYRDFGSYLHEQCELVAQEDAAVIFRLRAS